MVTLPAHQRKGAGAAHLKWGTTLADEENMPISLQATPDGKKLCLKFGFEVVKEVEHDLSICGGTGKYTHFLMVRYPNNGKVAPI